MAKAASAAALGLVFLKRINPATMEWLSNWSSSLPRPTETLIVKGFIGRVGSLSKHELHIVGWSALAYAALSATEAIGLWLGHRWAQWLSLTISGFFIPVEVVEWARHVSLIRTGVLTVNTAILLYLVCRIYSDRRSNFLYSPTT